jgi:hypothetical protein
MTRGCRILVRLAPVAFNRRTALGLRSPLLCQPSPFRKVALVFGLRVVMRCWAAYVCVCVCVRVAFWWRFDGADMLCVKLALQCRWLLPVQAACTCRCYYVDGCGREANLFVTFGWPSFCHRSVQFPLSLLPSLLKESTYLGVRFPSVTLL